MNRMQIIVRLGLLASLCGFSVRPCLGEQTALSPIDAMTRNAPEPRWLFDNVETDYISTPVLALRKALREQIRKERSPETLRKDREAAEKAERGNPYSLDAWLMDTTQEERFSPEVCRLRQELRHQTVLERAARRPRTEEMKQIQLERRFTYQKAQMTLKGTVTDKDGTPLHGVWVSILERHGTYLLDGEKKPETNVTRDVAVNGDFTLVCEDVNSVYLTFRAKGFFTEKRHYVVPHPPVDQPLEKGKEVTFDKIHVVLEKAGERARLWRYNANLISDLDGPVSVGDLALLGGQKKNISRKVNHGEPVTFPSLSVKVDYPKGQLVPADGLQYTKDIRSGVARVSLSLEDSEGDGLILVESGDKHYPQVMADLAEAPADGYQSHVYLKPEQARYLWDGNVLPMIVKVGERYGKGGIFFLRYSDPLGIKTTVELNMQLDGSRNLLTRK